MAENPKSGRGFMEQLQRLDDLIFKLTEPPIRTQLRNQLALLREQVEAFQASSDKQDETLAAQLETITTLQTELSALKVPTDFFKYKGALFKRKQGGGYETSVYCRKCEEPMVCLTNGLPYRCSPCGVTVDFTEGDLQQVIRELPK